MAKDAYYFSHDSNAKDDPKCVLLIEQLGAEGYGIFWILIETLRDQPNYKYPLALIPAIARRYNTTAEKMKTVVMQYGLFQIEDDKFFFSDSLNRRMESFEHRKQIASYAGKKSAEKRLALNVSSTDVQPAFNEGSTLNKIRGDKKRVNKSKEYIEIFSSYSSNNSDLFKALNDFAEMRKSINKPLSTERAAQMLLTKLDGITSDSKIKIAILEQSTFHNWQSAFPLKGDDDNGRFTNNVANTGQGATGSAKEAPKYGHIV